MPDPDWQLHAVATFAQWLRQFPAAESFDGALTVRGGQRYPLSFAIAAGPPMAQSPAPAPVSAPTSAPASAPAGEPSLRPKQRALLAGAGREPVKKTTVIRHAGLKPGGDSYRCLKHLCKLGLLEEHGDKVRQTEAGARMAARLRHATA